MKNPFKKEVKKEVKSFNLSKEDIAELGYLAQKRHEYQEITNFWNEKVINLQRKIEGNLSIDINKNFVNWGHVFLDGKITVYPKLEVKEVKPKEEVKVNGEADKK